MAPGRSSSSRSAVERSRAVGGQGRRKSKRAAAAAAKMKTGRIVYLAKDMVYGGGGGGVPVLSGGDGSGDADDEHSEEWCSGDEEEYVESLFERIVEPLLPFTSKIGFGTCMGFCVGVAAKTAARTVCVFVGCGFIIIQSLQYAGYLHVYWDKVQDDVIKVVDTDGSGTITVKDARHYFKWFMGVVKMHGPTVSSFGIGVYTGLYMG